MEKYLGFINQGRMTMRQTYMETEFYIDGVKDNQSFTSDRIYGIQKTKSNMADVYNKNKDFYTVRFKKTSTIDYLIQMLGGMERWI